MSLRGPKGRGNLLRDGQKKPSLSLRLLRFVFNRALDVLKASEGQGGVLLKIQFEAVNAVFQLAANLTTAFMQHRHHRFVFYHNLSGETGDAVALGDGNEILQ